MSDPRRGQWAAFATPEITSTTAAPTSSSQDPRQTFRERLATELPLECVTFPQPAVVVDPNQAFFDSLGKRRPIIAPAEKPALPAFRSAAERSTPPTPEPDLVTELHEKYAVQGASILRRATGKLNDVQASLETGLATLCGKDSTILSIVMEQHARLCRPLASAALKVECTDPKTGATRTEKIYIGTRVTGLQKRLAALEGELGDLWDEWEAAQRDVATAVATLQAGGGEEGERAVDMVGAVRTAVEEELERVVEDILEEMNGAEQKATKLIDEELGAVVQVMLSEPSQYD